MKKKLTIILGAIAIIAIGSATAALLTLSMDREIKAGSVAIDSGNVPIVFTGLSGYEDAVSYDADGEFSVDLTKAVSGEDYDGFNPDAQFVIGAGGIFSITNNSDGAVDVALASTSGLSLVGPASLVAGASGNYSFTLDTNGMSAGDVINGTLSVVSQ